ncbi:hypothetical protein ACOMHN_020027 [Nucella lapillus]
MAPLLIVVLIGVSYVHVAPLLIVVWIGVCYDHVAPLLIVVLIGVCYVEPMAPLLIVVLIGVSYDHVAPLLIVVWIGVCYVESMAPLLIVVLIGVSYVHVAPLLIVVWIGVCYDHVAPLLIVVWIGVCYVEPMAPLLIVVLIGVSYVHVAPLLIVVWIGMCYDHVAPLLIVVGIGVCYVEPMAPLLIVVLIGVSYDHVAPLLIVVWIGVCYVEPMAPLLIVVLIGVSYDHVAPLLIVVLIGVSYDHVAPLLIVVWIGMCYVQPVAPLLIVVWIGVCYVQPVAPLLILAANVGELKMGMGDQTNNAAKKPSPPADSRHPPTPPPPPPPSTMATLCHCTARFFIHVFLFVTNTSSSSSSSSRDAQPDDANNSASDWSERCNSTSTNRSCQLQDVIECIEMYLVPVLIVLGVGGSILGTVVLLATFLRFKFLSHLLVELNVSAAAFLLTLLLSWLARTRVDVFVVPGLCQLHVFSSHFFTFLTVWSGLLGAGLVLHDWLRPVARGWRHSPTAAKTLAVALAVLGFTLYSYKTWTHFSLSHRGHRVCTVIPDNQPVMEILNVLDVLLLLVVPSVLHVGLVGTALCVRLRPRWPCPGPARRHGWGARRGDYSTPPGAAVPVGEEMTSHRRHARRPWREVHRLVVSQSACFLLLVTPRAVSTLIVIVHRWVYQRTASSEDILVHHVFQFSFYVYFALLPYCPVLTSDQFRLHCLSLLTARPRLRPGPRHNERLLYGNFCRP